MAVSDDFTDAEQYTLWRALTCYQATLALVLGVPNLGNPKAILDETNRCGDLVNRIAPRR